MLVDYYIENSSVSMCGEKHADIEQMLPIYAMFT